MTGTDLEAVLLAVKATMETVSVEGSSIGKISLEYSDDPGWMPDRYNPPYWELSVTGATETDNGPGPQIWEDVVVQIEGFLYHYLPRRTSALWRRFMVGVKDALRENPTLKNPPNSGGTVTVWDSGRPQWDPRRDAMVTFNTGKFEARCHHGIILLRCRNGVTYTTY